MHKDLRRAALVYFRYLRDSARRGARRVGDEIGVSLTPFGLFLPEALLFPTLTLFFGALGFDLDGAFVEGRQNPWDLGFDSLLALIEPALASWEPATGAVDSHNAERAGREALGSGRMIAILALLAGELPGVRSRGISRTRFSMRKDIGSPSTRSCACSEPGSLESASRG
jgi:hypothetical protein